MKIYEIDREIMSCVDDESGEVIDIERLMQLQMERDSKLENIACYIVNLKADADAIKAQESVLKHRREVVEHKMDSLKRYLSDCLNGEKFKSPRVACSFRKSEQVEISDVTGISPEYMVVKTTTEPNKTAIKEAIKNGLVIPGCSLVTKNNIQIK